MAKKKNSVDVDVNVKGKGTKKTTLEMKNLGDQTKKVSKSTAEANRNWKGASKQSSGASKNFSKMSQGMGGIVGAYATLAANIFAIGAAFRFLESAGNLQKLKEGQELYAAATGTALRSLTKDIIAATDAQVTFENASQAAAIGVAAGLTNDQLVALGKGAKDVSIILGRDVTDSFNRLVRGVTKAEPELLDELGIILRLADASEKYGTMIGKNANDLTQFEKSQAVTVEVMSQLEDKYGRIMAVAEPSGNVFTQLGVAFDGIVNQIKEVAMFIAGPIAEVLTRVPALAFGILAAFANSLIKTSMAAWADRAAASAEKLGLSYKKAENRLKALQRLRRMKLEGQAGWSSTIDAKKADKALGGITSKGSVAGPALDKLRAGEKLSKAEIQAARMVVQRRKGLDKQMKDNYIAALKAMELKTKTTGEQIKIHFTLATSKIGILAKKAQLAWQAALGGIQRAAAKTAAFMTAAMSAISWISIIATLGTVIYQFFRTEEAVDEVAEELDAAGEKVRALNDEFKHFNEIQNIIIEDGDGFLQYFEALGGRISSLSVNMQKSLFDSFAEEATLSLSEAGALSFQFEMRKALGDNYEKQIQDYRDHIEELAAIQEAQKITMEIEVDELTGETKFFDFGPGHGTYENAVKELGDTIDTESEKLDKWIDRQAALGIESEWTANAIINLIKVMEKSPDPNTQGLGAFYSNMIEGAEEAFEIFKGAKNPVTDFMDVIKNNMENFQLQTRLFPGETEERLETVAEGIERVQTAVFGAKTTADEWRASLSSATRMARDNAQEVDKLLLGVQGRSTEGRMEDTLKNEIMERLKTSLPHLIGYFDALGREGSAAFARSFDFTPEGLVGQQKTDYEKRNAQLIRQIALFDSLDKKKRESEERSLKQQIDEQKLTAGTTKLVAKRLKLRAGLQKNGLKLIDIANEELEIQGLIAEARMDLGADWMGEEQQQDRLRVLGLQRDLLVLQSEELANQLNLLEQIKRAAEAAMETGLQKSIASFLKFDERSLSDALKKLAEGVFSAMADSVAKQAAEWIMRKDPLESFKDGGQIVHDKIIEAFQSVGFGGAGGAGGAYQGAGPNSMWHTPTEAEDETSGKVGIWERLFGKKVVGTRTNTQEGTVFKTDKYTNDPAGSLERAGTDSSATTRTASIFGPVISSFENLFAGEGPFLSRLGDFFGGDSSFLKGLGSMFGELGTGLMGLLGNIPGMGFLSFLGADGGIVKGGFRKYAQGGIATSPTLGLIGEGKHNEAVVPLPDGKAIPVDMRSSAQTNNVTVNVSTDGQTQTEGGADSEGLGRAVAKAVQEELQNQKRAGGILNRYGTA